MERNEKDKETREKERKVMEGGGGKEDREEKKGREKGK